MQLMAAVLKALPGELDVALAVHGGGRVHTFTRFTSKPGRLRDMAAGVSCKAGGTRLLDILERVLKLKRVGVVLYIGDSFEEFDAQACRLADALLKQETRVIILHDGPPPVAFGEIAERSGGALLPFDASALDQLGELLGAVAALAVGGVAAVEEQQAGMPAAAVLLEKLDPDDDRAEAMDGASQGLLKSLAEARASFVTLASVCRSGGLSGRRL